MVADKRVGDTPLTLKLSSGRATVEVSADGYTTYRKEVDLPGGGAITLDAELEKKDRHGTRESRSGRRRSRSPSTRAASSSACTARDTSTPTPRP